MKASIPFKLPVYKDQTVGANAGLIVEIGDTVSLVISNGPTAAPTLRDVVLTGVFFGGRTIEWDNSTTSNLLPEHVLRVHAKHQYVCAGAVNYSMTLTELNPDTVQASVISIQFGIPPVTYAINVTEIAAAANGIADEFVTRLVTAIQAVIGSEGSVSAVLTGVSGTQVVTVTITGLTLVPGTVTAAGLTPSAWAVI